MPDDKIIIPIVAQLDTLDAGLRAGERKIEESTRRMERTGGIGNKIGKQLASGIIAGLGAIAIDRALENALTAFDAGGTGHDIGLAVAEGLASGLRAIPVAGVLGEWLARTSSRGQKVMQTSDPLGLIGGTADDIQNEDLQKRVDEFRANREAISSRIARLMRDINSDVSPTDRFEDQINDLFKTVHDLKIRLFSERGTFDSDILAVIDELVAVRDAARNRATRDAAAVAARTNAVDRFDPRKLVDSFASPFGNVKLAAPGTPGVKAQFDTAENTKRTARDVEAIRKKLDALGALGFN